MAVVGERKDFPEWAVTAVYMAQDGVCKNCGGSLDRGFHRHHTDGNHSNNSLENLTLLCIICHNATYATKAWDEHKENEKWALGKLKESIELIIHKDIPGASMERLLEGISMALKTSRNIYEIDKGIEYPPPSILAFKRFSESKREQSAIIEGFKEGLALSVNVVSEEVRKQAWNEARNFISKENNAQNMASKVPQ